MGWWWVLWGFLWTWSRLNCWVCALNYRGWGGWLMGFNADVFLELDYFNVVLLFVFFVFAARYRWVHSSHEVVMKFLQNKFTGILGWGKCNFLRFLFHVYVWGFFVGFLNFIVLVWLFILIKKLVVNVFGFWKQVLHLRVDFLVDERISMTVLFGSESRLNLLTFGTR